MSDQTDRIKIARILMTLFAGIYLIFVIVMFVYGVRLQSQYNSMLVNLEDYYYMSIDDIFRLDWAINADRVFYKGLLWSASLGLISVLICYPEKATDKYSRHVIYYLVIAGILRLLTGFIGIGISHKTITVKKELTENFDYYIRLEENRAIQTFMEEQHRCCGIDSPSDYNRFNISEYPNTCYYKDILNLEGCPRKIVNLYSIGIRDFGLTFIGTGIYEALGVIPAYHLHRLLNVPDAVPV